MPGGKGVTIDLRLSHQAIAEAIGSTRVTITRLLGELKSSSLLAIDRKKITIFDPIALAKDLIEGHCILRFRGLINSSSLSL